MRPRADTDGVTSGRGVAVAVTAGSVSLVTLVLRAGDRAERRPVIARRRLTATFDVLTRRREGRGELQHLAPRHPERSEGRVLRASA